MAKSKFGKRPLAVAMAMIASGLVACGTARLANGEPCVPTDALGQIVDNADPISQPTNRFITVWPGDTITVRLTEPEGYASAPVPQELPPVFPWSTPRSSDEAVLKPIAVCPFPGYGTTLPQTVTAFTATAPGEATILASVDPTYPNPPPEPGLEPPAAIRVTVNVTPVWVPWAVRIGVIALGLLIMAGLVWFWRLPRNLRNRDLAPEPF